MEIEMAHSCSLVCWLAVMQVVFFQYNNLQNPALFGKTCVDEDGLPVAGHDAMVKELRECAVPVELRALTYDPEKNAEVLTSIRAAVAAAKVKKMEGMSLYKQLDTNGDGKVTQEELIKGMTARGTQLSDAQVAAILKI